MSNKHKLIHISVQASLVYFISFLLGIIFHILYPLSLVSQYFINYFTILGFIFLIFGTILFFKSHSCRRKLEYQKKEVTFFTFYKGPYKISRHPIYFAKLIIILGFAFTVNSFFITILAIIAFILTFIVFRKKEEKILEIEWGEDYKSYKNKVKC